MRLKTAFWMATALSLAVISAQAAEPPKPAPPSSEAQKPTGTTSSPDQGVLFHPETSESEGEVAVEGKPIAYKAVAGTIVVHPKGWDDAAARETDSDKSKTLGDNPNPQAEASIFYVAYFKKGSPSADRPVTFLYNGGPGSSSVWLHMGAFGPRRVITLDNSHTPAAPYRLGDNAYSLLDVSDLVFIDAPGTGFSRIAGKDKEKAFWGVDADAHAFGDFVMGFLSKYGRWNSPKYLFGESYGTPRSAVLVNMLETGQSIDFNGVILLSQILNFDLSADSASFNPGSDEAYITALPTYAATALYHHRLAGEQPADLEAWLKEVERFATGEYAEALQAGSELDPVRRQAVVDVRSCVDWLESQGYVQVGVLGTSLGSCYAFIAAAMDARLKVCAFNYAATYFGDVVWTGQSTRHIRRGLEEAGMAQLDDSVGQLLQHVKDMGEEDNTIVIFMSDHGEMLGDHGIYLKGPYFYDCLTRVPLMIRWPHRFKADARVDSLVEMIDLAPTLMEATGIPIPAGMQGRPLTKLLTGETTKHRDSVYMEFYNSNFTYPTAPMLRSVRTERWKINCCEQDEYGELYDLQKDPGEFNNVWNDAHAKDAREMMLHTLMSRSIAALDPLPMRVAPW